MAQTNEPGRILVVDDLPANLRLISRWLHADGFEARTCDDPGNALEAVLSERPDAVLLDVRLPSHDGFSLCRMLKHDLAAGDLVDAFVWLVDGGAIERACLIVS